MRRFMASVPQPMSIGKLLLADGSLVPGFLCEPTIRTGATEITHHGSGRIGLIPAVSRPTAAVRDR